MAGLIGSTWPSNLRPTTLAEEPIASEIRVFRLDALTCQDFSPLVGESFLAKPESAPPLSLTLIEAKLLRPQLVPVPGLAARTPFSVVFRGPVDSRLEQGLSRVQHCRFGILDLFLAPIGPQTDVAHFEAIFS
ncbi:DUF6916 family protein [Singulisphaera sp. GP187]|uniref:DUF6916 family protein n=1 Tax=Singulisphaera sp. GP187 TaxID=1882752 RepID=UPI0039658CDB